MMLLSRILKLSNGMGLAACLALVLTGCGGGGSSMKDAASQIMLPAGGAPLTGTLTVPAGQSVTQGGVVYTCPSGGSDCKVTATADAGSVTYTGGTLTVTRATWPTQQLAVGSGLARSSAAPVYATAGTDNRVGAALASTAGGIPALSTSLHRQWTPTNDARLTSSSTFHVKSIRSDGSGVYTVSYVLDGVEGVVSFDETTDLDGDGYCCELAVGDVTHYLWSWTSDPVSDHAKYRYTDILGYEWYTYDSQANEDRDASSYFFVFGTRTEALPAVGEAIYRGELRARLFDPDAPSGSNSWDMMGNVRLAANFDMSMLQGRFYSLRVEVPNGTTEVSWPTSSFELSDFAVNNGQFTATLTGVDSDPVAAFNASARGFTGSILGEFYGPNAEEVAGVVAAERDEDGDSAADRVMVGAFDARSIDSGNGESDAFVVGFDVDQVAGTTASIDGVDSARLTVMAGGTIRLTVSMEDGTSTTSAWEDADHGTHPGSDYRTSFSRKTGVTEHWLYSTSGATGAWAWSGSDFDHFDVYGWENYDFVEGASWPTTDYSAENNPTYSYGRLVDGSRTPSASMPTSGNATYSGVVEGFEVPADDSLYPGSEWYWGNAMLTADFGAGSISGTFDGITDADDEVVDGTMTFSATVSGNTLSASDLSGSGAFAGYANGSVEGAFYGPGAAEVGGVFEAADATSTNLTSGWFGARQ